MGVRFNKRVLWGHNRAGWRKAQRKGERVEESLKVEKPEAVGEEGQENGRVSVRQNRCVSETTLEVPPLPVFGVRYTTFSLTTTPLTSAEKFCENWLWHPSLLTVSIIPPANTDVVLVFLGWFWRGRSISERLMGGCEARNAAFLSGNRNVFLPENYRVCILFCLFYFFIMIS